MSFVFRKPKKNIQRRVFGSNEDEENREDNSMDVDIHDDSKDTNVIETKKKKERKEKVKPKQTLLSFEDEEEGEEVFQVKKSSHSKKIMRLLDKERKKKKERMEIDEDDKNLKNNSQKSKEIVTDDLVMVVNKTVEKPLVLNGRAALVAGRDDISSDEDDTTTSITKHRFSHPDNVKIVVESGMIPDAAVIHAARKRRQRARELGSDYVPLEQAEKKDKGRLIREEDGDGSDEERIDMAINTQAQDQEKRREQFRAAQDENSEHESDKEMEEWENQQIRKGVTGVQISSIQNETMFVGSVNYYTGLNEESIENTLYNNSAVKTDSYGLKTPEFIANKLRERVSALKQTYSNHEMKLQQIAEDLDIARNELRDLDRKAPECAKRFRFYQELRGYVTDLVECLDEKIPNIQNLEQRWLEVVGKRASVWAERRRQDVRDQAEEITLQSRLNSRPRVNGHDEEARVRRAAEREGRRNRRRRCREQAAQQQAQLPPKHLEGMSSDDEFPEQDNILFKQQKDQILENVDQVFNDVVDEFSSLSSILEKFELWRQTDFTAYSEAYASLVLPKIIGPILRLQLIAWDPFNSSSTDLEQFGWMKTLMLYGLTTNETEETLRSDPDINLVPAVIDKIILPKLKQLVEEIWDPMSSTQSLRLVGIIGRFVRRYPTLSPTSQSLNALFSAIVDKIQQAVEHDIFIPIFPKQVLETKSPFFQRQFHSAVKLLGNITCWQGTLADHVLKDLAINSLLNRYLLSGLRVCQITDTVSKAQLILNALPRVWLQSDMHEDLRMFIMCISQISGQLNSDNPLHLESLEILSSIKNTLHIN